MLASSRCLRWTLLGLPLFLIAFVAYETVSTSTPSPTPTATPVPFPEPILADLNDSPRKFFLAFPQEEQQRLVQALGQARLYEVLDGAEPTEVEDTAMEQCISQETFARVLTGSFINLVYSSGRLVNPL